MEYCGLRPPRDEFEEFLGGVHNLYGGDVFPNMAVWEVPKVLSDETKERLMGLGVEKAGRILIEAIEEINQGSVERLDTLINGRM